MMTVEQLREIGNAVRDLGYVSAYNYDKRGHDRARVTRVIDALAACAEYVRIPESLQTLVDAARSLEALETVVAKRAELRIATHSAVAEGYVAVALEIKDWFRGEGAYEVASTVSDDVVSAAESAEPIATSEAGS